LSQYYRFHYIIINNPTYTLFSEPYGEIVLVIPLNTDGNADKQLGMLSEAEVRGFGIERQLL